MLDKRLAKWKYIGALKRACAKESEAKRNLKKLEKSS